MTADEDRAAALAVRHAADRAHATPTDLGRVLAALFATPATDIAPIAPSHVHRGESLSPGDRAEIARLLQLGRDSKQIVEEVGCSVQAVNGVRAILAKQRQAVSA